MHEILTGDCLEVLKSYPDNNFTSIITDPPYGLSFMGKKWDYDVPSVEIWKECLRVLKPGGTMLCFAGSRTQHRMAVNVEDAGFLIKDCLLWLYGSGFPKATDISKQLDKIAGAEREVIGTQPAGTGPLKTGHTEISGGGFIGEERSPMIKITAPSTPEAQLWNGYKSHGLKPAYEPIIMAMKPNDGSYAANALKHGVSGINIDAGRIGTDTVKTSVAGGKGFGSNFRDDNWKPPEEGYTVTNQGRFPANILLDEEAAEQLGEPSRFFYTAKASKAERNKGCEGLEEKHVAWSNQAKAELARGNTEFRNKDETTAKHNKVQSLKNSHPCVKPISLMKYLLKLLQPPKDGLLLDPFAGSGTTIVAAKSLGFNAIGIEKSEEYSKIAKARIAAENLPEKDLF